jgi:hypothetical protein
MEPYRQVIAVLDLAIERGTKRVPGDGYFYVVLKGEILGRYRTLKAALQRYKGILSEHGWKPEPAGARPVDPATQAVERYMDSLETYWDSAHQHRRRGGKTMYRS